jgi:hypothetical protein
MPRLLQNSLIDKRKASIWTMVASVLIMTVYVGYRIQQNTHASTAVNGMNYLICDNPGNNLTSPWTYHSLASGTQDYTVSQYQALPGYGTTLPPLPSYISGMGGSAMPPPSTLPGPVPHWDPSRSP